MRPLDVARSYERSRRIDPAAAGAETMAGYGLMGLTFDSGDVLAFRCFTASSIGPPYLSVWRRHPDGRWTIHTNIEPSHACPRYFGPALHARDVDDITLAWSGGAELSIAAARSRIHLALRMAASPMTRLLRAAALAAPASVWGSPRTGSIAGRLLRAGRLMLAGTVPAGHRYIIEPRWLWRVEGAAAVIDGRDAGGIVVPRNQAALGDFLIPNRGLFAAGRVTFRAGVAAEDSRNPR